MQQQEGCLSFPLSHFHSTALCVPSLPQMAVLEIQSNGDSSYVSQEAINSAIQSLEDPLQRVRDGTSRRRQPTRLVELIFIASRSFFLFPPPRSSSRSVWRSTPRSDPQPGSFSSTRPCSRCPYSSCWLRTASSATSVSGENAPPVAGETNLVPHCWTITLQ